MKKIFLAISLALFSFAAFAGEPGQELTTIVGTNIDMKIYDHAMAGAMKDFVVWGFFDESTGSAELIMRKYDQTIKTVFKKENDKLGGMITHTQDGVRYDTAVEFVKVDPAKKEIHLKINEEAIVVAVEPESVNGGHMVNIKFTTVLKGETVSYVLGGESCFGKSAFFAMMILGAYSH